MAATDDIDDPVWQQALDWLFRLDAAPGDAALRAAFDAWLQADPRHAANWRRASETWAAMGTVPPAHRHQWHGARSRTQRPLRAGILAATALAACLALWLASDALWPAGDFHTRVGQSEQIVLEDGSRVTLDTDSALDVAYSSTRRAVTLLHGQAYFEVAANALRPFTVDAGGTSVTVIGTAFGVRLAPDDIQVAVHQGIVEVAPAGSPVAVERLAPGQTLRIDRHEEQAFRGTVDPAAVAAWRQGLLIVDGITVGEALAEIGRYHTGLILQRDPELAARQVTGIYDLTDPLAALAAILRPHGGTIRQITPYLVIIGSS
ncbi:MAG: FecR family protein [Alphaproteobacteria bacterium]|nr:FecR family protein [Alphaproteobacteria bacterium]